MRAILPMIAASALLALAPDASAQDKGVAIAPRPDWVAAVEPLPPRDEDRRHIEDGVFDALYDTQARLDGDRYHYYRRSVQDVVTQAGLEGAGRLEFVFDPSEEEFAVHALKIVRDGRELDRLDANAFSVFRREAELDDGVTDGTLTAYLEVKDLKVGDRLDYEISWTTRSQLWPGEYFDDFDVQWSVPVGRFHHRIVVPEGKPLFIRTRGAAPAPKKSAQGGAVAYDWTLERPAPLRGEDAVPATYAMWGEVRVTTLPDWRSVVASLLPHYEDSAVLPEGFLDRVLAGVAANDRNAKITRAIRYAQDEIRYVADEVGVGGHKPRAPSAVIERGWGDCKDKALLLAAMLRALGVKAHVALTDNDEGHALPQVAPSPFAYDHAIVVAVVDGKRRWIDATWSHQGGVFPDIAPPAYGYALPLADGVGALWPIELATAEAPELSIVETYAFHGPKSEAVDLLVESLYRGKEADSFRSKAAATAIETLSKDYLEYYQKLYPGIEAEHDLRIEDDRDAGALRLTERYRLPRAKLTDDLLAAFPLQADAVRNVLDAVAVDGRKAPLALPFPKHLEHVIRIKDAGVELEELEDFSAVHPEFALIRTSAAQNDDLTLTWNLKTLAPEAPKERVTDYAKVVADLDDWSSLEYDLTPRKADASGPISVGLLVGFVIALVLAIAASLRKRRADAP